MTTTRLSDSSTIVVADIGGTHIQMGHIDDNHTKVADKKINSDHLRTDHAKQALATLLESYIHEHTLSPQAIVIGIPGLIDQTRTQINHCNNIPQLEGHGLRQHLSDYLGCPVFLEQDIMLQVLGEWQHGVAQKSEAVFGIYFGTGIGTAHLRNGDPTLRGSSTLQAGHIPVSNQGKQCICGNTDCIEAYASGHTLIEISKKSGIPITHLFTQRSDKRIQTSISEFILYQAYMIASVITLTEPDMVLIGGGIPTMPDYPKDELLTIVRKHLQSPHPADSVSIEWATLASAAPLYGAVALLNPDHSHSQTMTETT